MKKRICVLMACAAPVLSPFIAHAGTCHAGGSLAGGTPWAASLGMGTTGITAGLFYRETSNLVTDAEVGGFIIDPSFSAGGENYHMGIRLLSARLAEDWYLFNGNLFLAAGVLFNADKFNLQPRGGQGNYSFATPASFRFSPVAPYLGIGWGYPFKGSQWTFRAEVGAAYEGSSKVSVTMGTDPYALPAYQAEKSSISAVLGGYHWYPVAQVGLVYRFR